MKKFSITLFLTVFFLSFITPTDIQRLILRYLLYFVLTSYMFIFYRGTKILHLGQAGYFAMGMYAVSISGSDWALWIFSIFALSITLIVVYFLLKDMEPTFFGISSLCVMGILEELARTLRGITGGVDGLFRPHPHGLIMGLLIALLLVLFSFLYHEYLLRKGFSYKSQMVWNGRIFAESLGLSTGGFRFSLFLPSAICLYSAGMAHGLSEGYITLSSAFHPGLTLIPISATLLCKDFYLLPVLVMILLGFQELLSYLAWGYQGTVMGGILILIAYHLLMRKESPG